MISSIWIVRVSVTMKTSSVASAARTAHRCSKFRTDKRLPDLSGGLFSWAESGMDGTVGGSACYASKWLDFLDPLIEQKITETGSCTVPLPQQHSNTRRECMQNNCLYLTNSGRAVVQVSL